MKRLVSQFFSVALLASPFFSAEARSMPPAPRTGINLEVIGDNSGLAQEYPVTTSHSYARAYIQANKNERYRLKVTNNTANKIGVVLAVDGRNIISGQRSNLANNERMYILNPYETATYEGWRTGRNQTNRFYYTDSGNSYAAAWGDKTAMGVIAMAAYPEIPPPRPVPVPYSADRAAAAAPAAPSAARKSEAGTGFGENTYSPSHTVEFKPQSQPVRKEFLKYEWKNTLCAKKILPQCNQPRPPANRFWPDTGYAPAPPR